MASPRRRNSDGIDHSKVQRPASKRCATADKDPSIPQPQPPPVALRQISLLSTMPDLTLMLNQLHAETTTWDIFKAFQKHGTIAYIEIFQTTEGEKTGRGRIRFSPPPYTAFWKKLGKFKNYPIVLESGHGTFNARVTFDEVKFRNRQSQQIRSPIRPQVFYDTKMRLIPSRLQFGLMMEPDKFTPMAEVKAIPGELISFDVDLNKRRLAVTFMVTFIDPRSTGDKSFVSKSDIGEFNRKTTFMFQIPFTTLKTIRKRNIPDAIEWIIALDGPPTYYRKRLDIQASHSNQTHSWTEFDSWYRQTDIMFDPHGLHTKMVSLHKEDAVIDIGKPLAHENKLLLTDAGRWTTYGFTFYKNQNDKAKYTILEQALSDFNVDIVLSAPDKQDQKIPKVLTAQVWSLIDHHLPRKCVTELLDLGPSDGPIYLPFEVRYQLEVCISREILNEHNITREFVTKLAEMTTKDPLKSQYLLEYVAEQGKRIFNPMTIFEDSDALAFAPKTDIPHYCGLVRKAIVTPTTIYFSSPTVEITNRVVRKYSKENLDGRFLRVQFADEMSEVCQYTSPPVTLANVF
jgi:RNA-dependent RNA polymerase